MPTEVNEGKAKVMCVKFNNRRFCVVIRDSDGETVRGGLLFKNKDGSYVLGCTKNHSICDVCSNCGASGCVLERGYN